MRCNLKVNETVRNIHEVYFRRFRDIRIYFGYGYRFHDFILSIATKVVKQCQKKKKNRKYPHLSL